MSKKTNPTLVKKFNWLNNFANKADYAELEQSLINYAVAESIKVTDLEVNAELLRSLHPHLCIQNQRWVDVNVDKMSTSPNLLNSFYTKLKTIVKNPETIQSIVDAIRHDLDNPNDDTELEKDSSQNDTNKPILIDTTTDKAKNQGTKELGLQTPKESQNPEINSELKMLGVYASRQRGISVS